MRIDGAIPPSEDLQTQNVGRHGPSVTQSLSVPAGGGQDQTELSADPGKAVRLNSALSQVPEIRQERVQGLRHAVQSSNYHVSNQQLADAIGSDLIPSRQTQQTQP